MHRTEQSKKKLKKEKPYFPKRQVFHSFLETSQMVESLYEGNGEISPMVKSNLNWSVGKMQSLTWQKDLLLTWGKNTLP